MGREASITYEQVAAVADAMKAAGAKPTSRSVRERLGNVGSMGTVNKLLAEWKARQERQIANALTLPANLQRAMLDFMAQELNQAKAALEADLAEQQQETADLAAENERQAAEIDAQVEKIATLQAELATVRGRSAQLEADLAAVGHAAEREREAAERARIELAKAQLRLEAMPRLEGDLTAVRADLERERAGRVVAEQAAAVLTAKLEAVTNRADKAEATAGEALTDAKRARDEAAELRGAGKAK